HARDAVGFGSVVEIDRVVRGERMRHRISYGESIWAVRTVKAVPRSQTSQSVGKSPQAPMRTLRARAFSMASFIVPLVRRILPPITRFAAGVLPSAASRKCSIGPTKRANIWSSGYRFVADQFFTCPATISTCE